MDVSVALGRRLTSQSSTLRCRPLATASPPVGTSSVTADPAATKAPSEMSTGATSTEFDPMKAEFPTWVVDLFTPS